MSSTMLSVALCLLGALCSHTIEAFQCGRLARGGAARTTVQSQALRRTTSVCRAEEPSTSHGRREVLVGAASFLLATAAPSGADASYALYKASQDSYTQRKEDGYVPTATSDRESLAEIQAEIARKRPRSELQKKRKPQYCAGQMGSVQPMMENICENIGLSKADQSNTLPDAYGNMNVGAYAEKLERERLEREAAAKAARAAGRSS